MKCDVFFLDVNANVLQCPTVSCSVLEYLVEQPGHPGVGDQLPHHEGHRGRADPLPGVDT